MDRSDVCHRKRPENVRPKTCPGFDHASSPRDASPSVQFTTHGIPQDIHAARDLAARGKYHEFEKWALSLIAAQPGNFGKKGTDPGLDGRLYFGAKDTTLGIVSVKAGENIGVSKP